MKEIYKKESEPPKKGFSGFRLSIPLVLMTLLCAVGITLALLSTLTNVAENPFALGTVDIDIPEITVENNKEVLWGTNTKQVMLSNVGTVDSVARALVVPQFKNKETGAFTGGNLGTLKAPTGTTLAVGDFIIHFAESFSGGQSKSWFYKDGYFYYREVLKPKGVSSPLITGITLSPNADAKDYEKIGVDVEVIAGNIQAEGNAPGEEWGVSVTNGIVSPSK